MKTQIRLFDGLEPQWMEEQILKNPLHFFSFLDGLFEPRFSVGQIGISRQELQYWRKNELIGTAEISDVRTWIKVSFFDYCWLKLVAEMRKLFIPIEHIKKVKQTLFSFDKDVFIDLVQAELERMKNSRDTSDITKELIEDMQNDPVSHQEAFRHMTFFMYILLDLIRRNSPASLVIDKEGDCTLILLNEYLPPEKLSDLIALFEGSFTAIRLNGLLDEFYTNPRIQETHLKDIFKLTDKEMKVLSLLRKEGIKEVRVRIGDKGKGIVLVEVVEEKNINAVKEKLKAILDKGKVQNIRISSFEGTLLLFEETTKIKL